jgi:hypothetical protein
LQEKHSEVLATLFLNFGIDYGKAQLMRRSDVQTIFESKAFSDWRKSQEARQKIDLAVVERLDIVIRSIGNLGKALSR